MEIITIAHNRPDFIEMQFKSFKHLKDEFIYTVFYDDNEDKVKKVCKKLGIKCIKIDRIMEDSELQYDASARVALHQNWIYSNYKFEGLTLYLDSDMFFIKDICIIDEMKGYDLAYVPLYAGGCEYMWSGLQIYNGVKNLDKLDWRCAYLGGEWGTHGASTFHWLQENKPKVKHITQHTLLDSRERTFMLNGLLTYQQYPELVELTVDFPKPECIDMFKFDDYFLFHHKNASNYEDVKDKKYTIRKTKAIKKIL